MSKNDDGMAQETVQVHVPTDLDLINMVMVQLTRLIQAGQPPVEVRGSSEVIQRLKALDWDAYRPVYQERNLGEVYDWWVKNLPNVQWTVQPQLQAPVLMSAVELAESQIFERIFQVLTERGLAQALQTFGISIEQLARSPKMLQDTLWFQFQMLLKDQMDRSHIIVPGVGIDTSTLKVD